MTIERIDPAGLDDSTAERLADITNALKREAGDPGPLAVGASIRLRARYTSSNRPVDAMWLARDQAGSVVGQASYEPSHWDNPHFAMVSLEVDPAADRDRLGGLLLDGVIDQARADRRTTLMTFQASGGWAEQFLCAHAFEMAQREVRRRLWPQRLDFAHITELADTATRRAGDYELVSLDGPTPTEWLDELRVLHEAINDAPLDGIDAEPDVFPAERITAYDTAMAARGQRVYRLMARHRVSGEWAGHTILCVDTLRPGVAFQEDTSVVRAHRGHRLGMLLKARMLLWMREAHPELELIDTYNAETNAHMIGVNEELGCEVASLASAVQRLL